MAEHTSNKEHEHGDGVPIVIDDKHYEAPKHRMTGLELRQLAKPPIGQDRDLFLEVHGKEDDIKVGNDQVIELKPGMHFYSAPATINPGDGPRLPEQDEKCLNEKGYRWTLKAGGCLVLEGVSVSAERYDRQAVDLMIRIPPGYPMAALDMFYVRPELKLKSGGYPQAAEAFEEHCGQRWQRFSRHLQDKWQVGVDSVRTFLAVILAELQGRR